MQTFPRNAQIVGVVGFPRIRRKSGETSKALSKVEMLHEGILRIVVVEDIFTRQQGRFLGRHKGGCRQHFDGVMGEIKLEKPKEAIPTVVILLVILQYVDNGMALIVAGNDRP